MAGKAVLSRDTAPDVEALQVEIWRSMSPAEKANLVSAASRSVYELALAGIRQRHPDASEEEVAIRWSRLALGIDWARRLHPEAGQVLGS